MAAVGRTFLQQSISGTPVHRRPFVVERNAPADRHGDCSSVGGGPCRCVLSFRALVHGPATEPDTNDERDHTLQAFFEHDRLGDRERVRFHPSPVRVVGHERGSERLFHPEHIHAKFDSTKTTHGWGHARCSRQTRRRITVFISRWSIVGSFA